MFAHRDIIVIQKQDAALAAIRFESVWLAAGSVGVCYC